MSTVLVTGAAGFIGASVIESLKHKGFTIHAVWYNRPPNIDSSLVKWHKANLLNLNDIQHLLARVRPTYLIHLAWCTSQDKYWTDPSNLQWLTSGIELARCFVNNGGRRCIFAGTSAEYDWTTGQVLKEGVSILNPQKLYGGSKLGLYWILKRYFEQEDVGFAWTRFFNPFGERENVKRLIPKTCLRLLNGENLFFDAARSLRDFLHIKDIGSAIVSVLQSKINGPVNIASGIAVSVRDVITTIAEIYQTEEQVHFSEDVPDLGAPDAVVADIELLTLDCNWSPDASFRERLEQTCAWWKTQNKQ